MLNINEVRVKEINRGKFLGYASILIDNSIIIDGIELFEGNRGRYFLMPLNPKVKRTRKNSSYPINEETREQILEAISEEYDKKTEE